MTDEWTLNGVTGYRHKALAYGPDLSPGERVCVVRKEALEEARAAITKALSALSSTQYKDGLTEREAWRVVTETLAPFVLPEQGCNP